MRKFSVMTQLWGLTLLLVGIIAILGGFTFWRSSSLYGQLEDTALVQIPALRNLMVADMLHDGLRAVVIESLYKAEKNQKKAVQDIQAEKNEKIDEFRAQISDLEKLNLSEKMRNQLKEVKPALEQYLEVTSQIVDFAAQGQIAEAQSGLTQFEEKFVLLEERLELLGNSMESQAKDFSAEGSMTLTLIGIISIGGIVIGLGFTLWSMIQLKSYIISFLREIAGSSHQVSAVSQDLASANNQFSASANQTASSLQETVASLDELSSMVTANTGYAQKASELSIKGRNSAEFGEKKISELSSAMGEIKSSSRRMEEIIITIEDIAFQTNLLALNAAVEAARAGEQGKGFAVVADAVRALAQRSAMAAKDISQLIKESLSKINSGDQIVVSSQEMLQSIFQSVKEISELNQQIATASDEQSTGIRQITQAMNQLDTASQTTANGAQEVAHISQKMSQESVKLRALLQDMNKRLLGASTINGLALNRSQVTTLDQNKAERDNVVPFEDTRSIPTQFHQAKDPDQKIKNLSNF